MQGCGFGVQVRQETSRSHSINLKAPGRLLSSQLTGDDLAAIQGWAPSDAAPQGCASWLSQSFWPATCFESAPSALARLPLTKIGVYGAQLVWLASLTCRIKSPDWAGAEVHLQREHPPRRAGRAKLKLHGFVGPSSGPLVGVQTA